VAAPRISTPLIPQDIGLAQLYEMDRTDCFKKYLCEVSRSDPSDLLDEEKAILNMLTNQVTSVRDMMTTTRGQSRVRRSNFDLSEAVRIAESCAAEFPRCATSRIDILKTYSAQKEAFCSTPLPYNL